MQPEERITGNGQPDYFCCALRACHTGRRLRYPGPSQRGNEKRLYRAWSDGLNSPGDLWAFRCDSSGTGDRAVLDIYPQPAWSPADSDHGAANSYAGRCCAL